MKSSAFFCVVAMAFYALEIAFTDWKLTNISPRLLTFFFSAGVAVCAAIGLAVDHQELCMPQRSQWIFVLLMIAASFVAALAHFRALNEQSGAVMLTMFYCLMPVAASLYMACFRREVPNLRTMLAWAVAAFALYLISTGKK